MTREHKKLLPLLPPEYKVTSSMGYLKLKKGKEVLAVGCANVSKTLRELTGNYQHIHKFNRYYRRAA